MQLFTARFSAIGVDGVFAIGLALLSILFGYHYAIFALCFLTRKWQISLALSVVFVAAGALGVSLHSGEGLERDLSALAKVLACNGIAAAWSGLLVGYAYNAANRDKALVLCAVAFSIFSVGSIPGQAFQLDMTGKMGNIQGRTEMYQKATSLIEPIAKSDDKLDVKPLKNALLKFAVSAAVD